MSAIQLNFSLRTSAHCKTVHLLGSWDGYKGQLPLSKDSSKAGAWKGTFRFQNTTLKQGQRYWYYYIIDGYHVSHDPARQFTTEPTTGRNLNILDVPSSKSGSSSKSSSSSKRHQRHISADVPKGRALSPSQIQSPRPVKPNQTRQIVSSGYSQPTMDALSMQLRRTAIVSPSSDEDDDYSESDSDDSSSVPSLTSRSTQSSSPSSVSSQSSCCTCERYGITRSGDRVKLDCGGARCGYSDESSECSSDDDTKSKVTPYQACATRRQGIVVRS